MIPLRSSERIYSRTVVVPALIAINLLLFMYEFLLSFDGRSFDLFILQWGIVPDRLNLLSLLTSMFLHGGWMHVLGNMLFLWVFGRNLEDLIGSGRFLVFYIVCGLAAAVTHVIFNPYSRAPTIGASGAIAGVMGAYLIKFPRSQIDTLVPIIFFFTRLAVPAPLYLLFWFLLQFVPAVGSLSETSYNSGGVAWFAHVGGFVAGMLLIRLFPSRQRWRAYYEEE
jgi:membrane associated rhomboid family serine protease